jgi:hypothetical protein
MECKGLLGRILGHAFERFIIKKGFVISDKNYYHFQGLNFDQIRDFMEAQRDIYCIKCKRCGIEPNWVAGDDKPIISKMEKVQE